MRAFLLVVLFYVVHALAPPFPPHADKSVTEAATFLTAKMPEVSPQQRLKRNIFGNIFRTDAAAKFIKGRLTASPAQSVKRRKPKRRIRRVVHRKPPTVWKYPDKIEVFSYAEFWAMERAKMKRRAAWCVGRAIR